MNGWESEFLMELNLLRSEIKCDFSALGLIDTNGNTLRWKLAAGNLNERWQAMVGQPGRGLSGTVVKVGRPMSLQLSELIRSRRLYEYPLLLSEKLRSAYAVPLMYNGKVAGVLLIGDRSRRVYGQEDRAAAVLRGERFSAMLAEMSAYSS